MPKAWPLLRFGDQNWTQHPLPGHFFCRRRNTKETSGSLAVSANYKKKEMDLRQILNSGIFWTAISAIAAVIAAIFPIIQAIKRQNAGGLTRIRVQELAEEGMNKFDYWMNNYNHIGNKPHKRKMLEWLEADSGVKIVGDNYSVFNRMAKLLKKKGYDTLPSPSKSEFLDAVERAKNREKMK